MAVRSEEELERLLAALRRILNEQGPDTAVYGLRNLARYDSPCRQSAQMLLHDWWFCIDELEMDPVSAIYLVVFDL